MNSFDHYVEAKKLCGLLRRDVLGAYADRIENAIAEGSTGTEIFMSMRMVLKDFIHKGLGATDTREIAARLFIEIEQSLQ